MCRVCAVACLAIRPVLWPIRFRYDLTNLLVRSHGVQPLLCINSHPLGRDSRGIARCLLWFRPFELRSRSSPTHKHPLDIGSTRVTVLHYVQNFKASPKYKRPWINHFALTSTVLACCMICHVLHKCWINDWHPSCQPNQNPHCRPSTLIGMFRGLLSRAPLIMSIWPFSDHDELICPHKMLM